MHCKLVSKLLSATYINSKNFTPILETHPITMHAEMKYSGQLSTYFPSASGAEQCYRGDVRVPIHSRPVHGISALEAFQIDLSASSKMYSRKPAAFQENVLFVADPKYLKSVDDLKADDNGVWLWTGKSRKWYKVEHYSDDNEPVSVKIISSPCVPLKHHKKVYQL